MKQASSTCGLAVGAGSPGRLRLDPRLDARGGRGPHQLGHHGGAGDDHEPDSAARSRVARRKVEFDAALFAEAVHDRLDQAPGLAWLGDGVGDNGADFGLHRSVVAACPHAEPFLDLVINVADA